MESNERTIRKLSSHWKKYAASLDEALEQLEAQRELVRGLERMNLTKAMRVDLKAAVKRLNKAREEAEAIKKGIELLADKQAKH